MKDLTIKLGLTIVAVFLPAEGVIFTVIALVLADLATGLTAARRQNQPITSTGLKRTVLKLAVYEIAVLSAFLVGTYLTGPYIPVVNVVAGLIGVTELKSILENLDRINGGSFFKAATDKIEKLTSNPEEK